LYEVIVVYRIRLWTTICWTKIWIVYTQV